VRQGKERRWEVRCWKFEAEVTPKETDGWLGPLFPRAPGPGPRSATGTCGFPLLFSDGGLFHCGPWGNMVQGDQRRHPSGVWR
jgi:hypothetical protein